MAGLKACPTNDGDIVEDAMKRNSLVAVAVMTVALLAAPVAWPSVDWEAVPVSAWLTGWAWQTEMSPSKARVRMALL